jgi:hypothetical protein
VMPTSRPMRKSKSKSKNISNLNSQHNSKPSSSMGQTNIETNVNKIKRLHISLLKKLGNYGRGVANLNQTFEREKIQLLQLLRSLKDARQAATVRKSLEDANTQARKMKREKRKN